MKFSTALAILAYVAAQSVQAAPIAPDAALAVKRGNVELNKGRSENDLVERKNSKNLLNGKPQDVGKVPPPIKARSEDGLVERQKVGYEGGHRPLTPISGYPKKGDPPKLDLVERGELHHPTDPLTGGILPKKARSENDLVERKKIPKNLLNGKPQGFGDVPPSKMARSENDLVGRGPDGKLRHDPENPHRDGPSPTDDHLVVREDGHEAKGKDDYSRYSKVKGRSLEGGEVPPSIKARFLKGKTKSSSIKECPGNDQQKCVLGYNRGTRDHGAITGDPTCPEGRCNTETS